MAMKKRRGAGMSKSKNRPSNRKSRSSSGSRTIRQTRSGRASY